MPRTKAKTEDTPTKAKAKRRTAKQKAGGEIIAPTLDAIRLDAQFVKTAKQLASLYKPGAKTDKAGSYVRDNYALISCSQSRLSIMFVSDGLDHFSMLSCPCSMGTEFNAFVSSYFFDVLDKMDAPSLAASQLEGSHSLDLLLASGTGSFTIKGIVNPDRADVYKNFATHRLPSDDQQSLTLPLDEWLDFVRFAGCSKPSASNPVIESCACITSQEVGGIKELILASMDGHKMGRGSLLIDPNEPCPEFRAVVSDDLPRLSRLFEGLGAKEIQIGKDRYFCMAGKDSEITLDVIMLGTVNEYPDHLKLFPREAKESLAYCSVSKAALKTSITRLLLIAQEHKDCAIVFGFDPDNQLLHLSTRQSLVGHIYESIPVEFGGMDGMKPYDLPILVCNGNLACDVLGLFSGDIRFAIPQQPTLAGIFYDNGDIQREALIMPQNVKPEFYAQLPSQFEGLGTPEQVEAFHLQQLDDHSQGDGGNDSTNEENT